MHISELKSKMKFIRRTHVTFQNKSAKHIKPSFLILGAQKAGTVALTYYLSQHPEIQRANFKEIHFFDQNRQYTKGTKYYHQHFPRKQFFKTLISFEASPEYLYIPHCAKRIYDYNPN